MTLFSDHFFSCGTHERLRIFDLGCVPYLETWDLQRTLNLEIQRGTAPAALIMCEHPPVITLGRSGKLENVLVAPCALKKLGVDLIQSDRGGDVTWHGPGQLVCYPLLDLRTKRRDVGCLLYTSPSPRDS